MVINLLTLLTHIESDKRDFNIYQSKYVEYLKYVEMYKETNSFSDNNPCLDKFKLFEECTKSYKNLIKI